MSDLPHDSQKHDAPDDLNPHSVLRVVSKFLIPFILLFAFYVQFHGDFGPGGGFQAGVIFAAGVILYALVFGMEKAREAVSPFLASLGMSVGVLLYAGVGVATWIMGKNYLDYDAFFPHAHHPLGQHIGIMLVELGVLITVASVMLVIFYAFAGREPDIDDEDW